MSVRKIRRALISVWDKTGIVEFAQALHGEFGIEIISTGGTAKALREARIPVTLVEDETRSPELMDGRVKTLHPRIHAGILADRDNPEHMRQLREQEIQPIDMVVVNLYPFENTVAKADCTFAEAIENIDIGGPCLLRAAAKNHRHVLVVESASAYENTLAWMRGELSGTMDVLYQTAAMRAFRDVTMYDAAITTWLSARGGPAGVFRYLELFDMEALRYGENPHQRATAAMWWRGEGGPDLTTASARCADQNKGAAKVSYNNFVDADAALGLASELTRAKFGHACVVIKHTNPCGVGIGSDAVEAYRKAYLGDPQAAMGGILAVNFEVTQAVADAVMESLDRWGKAAGAGAFFVEVWVAPRFADSAVKTIRESRKWGANVRLLPVGEMVAGSGGEGMEYRPIAGGMLIQDRDRVGLDEEQWKVVTRRPPTEGEMADLRLAWLTAKHTRSNAISICKGGMLIGNGAGQMSRVMSCRIATWLAKENGHEATLAGAVAGSDAFFPFRDGPDILIRAGVTAIIQPGGSKRDADTIAACDERDVAMIFTGTRHFKH